MLPALQLLLRRTPLGLACQGLLAGCSSSPTLPAWRQAAEGGASTCLELRRVHSLAAESASTSYGGGLLARQGGLAARLHLAGLPSAQVTQQNGQPAQQQQVRSKWALQPRQSKFKSAFRSLGFKKTIEMNTVQPRYGKYALRAMGHARIPAAVIEMCRRDMRRRLPRGVALWIRTFPSLPVSKKPLGVRMGRGKGPLEYWACVIRPGQMVFELDNCSEAAAKEAFRVVAGFLPMKTGWVEWR